MAQAKQNNVKDSRARILLVDDHAVVRFGIAQLINRQTDLVVCGEEEDASCAMNAINTLKPDLVIADISLKDSSGLELMRNIKAQYPRLPVRVYLCRNRFPRRFPGLPHEGGGTGKDSDGHSASAGRGHLCQ